MSTSHETSLLDGARSRILTRITFLGIFLFIIVPLSCVIAIMYSGEIDSIETIFARSFNTISAIAPGLWHKIYLFLTSVLALLLLAWGWSKRSAYGRFTLFFVSAYVFGLFLFALVPNTLDVLSRNSLLPSTLTYNPRIFGTALYLYFFTLFINIHHYFIDNVIWRRNNPHIREYLFTR